MKTTARPLHRTTSCSFVGTDAAEQLTLLPSTSTPARFRLSADTRARGLRHVAEIREMLAARTDRAPATETPATETAPRHDRAA